MAAQWWNDDDMGHGFLVPLVVAWVVWNERGRWRAVPVRPSWWGIPLLLAAATLHFAAVLGVGLFAASVALLVSADRRDPVSGGFRPAARVGLSAAAQSLHAAQAGLCLQHGHAAVAVAGQPHGGGRVDDPSASA
jgi:hypothetical protein